MSSVDPSGFDPTTFSGQARLFPLPDLVLFPHVMQPLHVFEPRYLDLMAATLGGDRLLAMAALAPGWEADYDGRPPLERVACLAKVATWKQMDDGRYNVLVLGLKRIQLSGELPPSQSYRVAQVEVWEDEYPESGAAARPGLHRALVAAFRGILPKMAESNEAIAQLVSGNIPLGMLADIIGYTLDLDRTVKLALLGERNVDARASSLVEHLQAAAEGAGPRGWRFKFPAEFSQN